MWNVLRRKLPWVAFTLVGATIVTFSLTSLLPGDPAVAILGEEAASPEAVEQLRNELNLDEPLVARYLVWAGNALTGDLGRSYRTDQPVWDAIVERLPVTLEVGGLAMLLAVVISVPLGTLAAYREDRLPDRAITVGTFALISTPNFMLAIALIYVFAVKLNWLPATGWVPLTVDPVANLRTALLPALTIGLGQMAIYTRVLRSDMTATMREDFIAFARVKGTSSRRILFRHALKPSALPLLTVAGVQVGAIMAGSVIVETLFALPGLGRLLVQSILQRDLIMVQGVVLFTSVSYVIVNLIVDIGYSVLDPRIRQSAAR